MSTAKCTALEAANYLIYLTNGIIEDMSNMKLNKMLYYAQGHNLKEYGTPLFDDEIEAWEHGPIIRSVYEKYKANKSEPIVVFDSDMARKMPPEASELLLSVARNYGRYTASALRRMTHVPKSPWDMVYIEGSQHISIPQSLIKEYFDSNEKDLENVNYPIMEDDFVGYRDEDGYLVLPGDWDDETV